MIRSCRICIIHDVHANAQCNVRSMISITDIVMSHRSVASFTSVASICGGTGAAPALKRCATRSAPLSNLPPNKVPFILSCPRGVTAEEGFVPRRGEFDADEGKEAGDPDAARLGGQRAVGSGLRPRMRGAWLDADRADPHARERVFDVARRDPPFGASPDDTAAEIEDVLGSIGDAFPECPHER